MQRCYEPAVAKCTSRSHWTLLIQEQRANVQTATRTHTMQRMTGTAMKFYMIAFSPDVPLSICVIQLNPVTFM